MSQQQVYSRVRSIRPAAQGRVVDIEWFTVNDDGTETVHLYDGIAVPDDATDDDIVEAIATRAESVIREVIAPPPPEQTQLIDAVVDPLARTIVSDPAALVREARAAAIERTGGVA